MTILKEIKGIKVQVLETNPTDLVEGQIWYNSTSQAFKAAFYGNIPGAWSTGGAILAARGNRGAGTQTAALSFGGSGADPSQNTYSFEYNGSTWGVGVLCP